MSYVGITHERDLGRTVFLFGKVYVWTSVDGKLALKRVAKGAVKVKKSGELKYEAIES